MEEICLDLKLALVCFPFSHAEQRDLCKEKVRETSYKLVDGGLIQRLEVEMRETLVRKPV